LSATADNLIRLVTHGLLGKVTGAAFSLETHANGIFASWDQSTSDFGLSRVCSNRIDKCPAIVARKTAWETGRTTPSSALDTKAAYSRWSGAKPTNQNHQVSIADRSSEGSKVFPVKAHQLQFLEHVVVVGAGIRRNPRLQHRRLELVKA
jgi:hypothetical protein